MVSIKFTVSIWLRLVFSHNVVTLFYLFFSLSSLSLTSLSSSLFLFAFSVVFLRRIFLSLHHYLSPEKADFFRHCLATCKNQIIYWRRVSEDRSFFFFFLNFGFFSGLFQFGEALLDLGKCQSFNFIFSFTFLFLSLSVFTNWAGFVFNWWFPRRLGPRWLLFVDDERSFV